MGPAAVIAVSLSAVAAIAYIQLRHAGLAALVIGFPLAFVAGLSAVFRAEAAVYAPYAFLFGVASALLTATRFVRNVCDGTSPHDAAVLACRETAKAVGPLFMAFVSAALILGLNDGIQERAMVAALASTVAFGAALAAGWYAKYLSYSEEFVARANRVREWGERRAEILFWLTQTRWALSVTGMIMVVAAIAFFAASGLSIGATALSRENLAAFSPLLLAFVAIVHNWRCTVTLTASFILIVMFTLWTFARERIPVGPVDFLSLGIVSLVALAPLAAFARRFRRALREDDSLRSSLTRTLRDEAFSIFLAGLILSIPTLIVAISLEIVPPELAIALAAQFSALIAFPALTETIYAIVPPYRSVEDVFGKR